MFLVAGSRLGPYEILGLIGAGGMGQVYKARDTRLDRVVAIKVSNEEFSERFEREARTVAALNHPNICQLYDVGPDYLVMEYIDGKPLNGPLPVEKALLYGVQILEGLDAAHHKGIIHRDLKPANILVTKAGIKLLDFGLAKFAGSVDYDAESTRTMSLTGENTIVGTLPYMSPEQLLAKGADARSDLYAFGLVLYEMLTGRRAFQSDTQAGLIASILKDDPPAPSSTLPGSIPAEVDSVVSTCLAKDPGDRWQSARDLKRELLRISSGGAPAVALQGTGRKRDRKRLWIVIAGLAGVAFLALAAVGLYWFGRTNSSRPSIRLGGTRQITFEPGLNLDPALSPDGKLVAYSAGPGPGEMHVHVRQLGAARGIVLTEGLPGSHRWPQWSPDGSQIAFFSVLHTGTRIRISTVPSLGGIPKRLVEADWGSFLCCPAWSPDGSRIAYASDRAVYVLPIAGARATKIAEHRFEATLLAWSPDGKRIAYVVDNPNSVFGPGNIAPSAIWVVPAAGGRTVQVTDNLHLNIGPAWTPDGKHLLFISNRGGRRDLYEVALRDSGEPAGTPTLLTTGLNA